MRIDATAPVGRPRETPDVHSTARRPVRITWLATDACATSPVLDAVRANLDDDLTTDRALDGGEPDLVVVRCDDPRVGLDHARQVSARAATVVVTASSDPEALVAAVDAGAIGCLVDHHYDAPALRLAIVRGLQGRRSWSGPTVAAVVGSLLPTRGRPPVTRCAALSARQREIMDLVSRGLGNRDVAARLFLSEKTIRNHMHNIYRAMEVGSRGAAVACWNRSLRTVDLAPADLGLTA